MLTHNITPPASPTHSPHKSKECRSDSGMADTVPIVDLRGNTAKSNTDSNLQSSIIKSLSTKNVRFAKDGVETLIRSIPTMVLYDDKGLEIFDKITYVDEYYLTEAEIDVLRNHAEECVRKIVRDGSVLVELGCGSMRKTKYILSAIERQQKRNVTYYAVDLSESSLRESLGPLTLAFPTINFIGLLGCYEDSVQYIRSTISADIPKTYLWLGSSIGNLNRHDAGVFLRQICKEGMSIGDTFLCGIDRRNDPKVVGLAYNDSYGVTKDFVMNGLAHVNKIFGEQVLDESAFEYVSIYNEVEGRHEAYYRSVKDQVVGRRTRVNGVNGSHSHSLGQFSVQLEKGELINVEYSYKYSRAEVDSVVEAAKFYHVGKWSDGKEMYDLHLFQKPPFFFEKGTGGSAPVPTREEWDELWKAWDTITTTMIPPQQHHVRPISLRHPYIFYLGHIPAFLDIQVSRALKAPVTEPSYYTRIFERGIDPDMEDPNKCHPHSEVPDQWPAVEDVLDYTQRVRERVRAILDGIEGGKGVDKRLMRALWMCYEHEAMHLETLLYMLLQSDTTLPPAGVLPPILPTGMQLKPAAMVSFTQLDSITTGLNDPEESDRDLTARPPNQYGWDNEKPVRTFSVAPFEIQSRMVTTAEYVAYLDKVGWEAELIPASWGVLPSATPKPDNAEYYGTKTAFGLLPLSSTAHFPVSVSADQALKYADIHGMRLPTEVELRYLKLRSKSGSRKGCIGFRTWIPAEAVEDASEGVETRVGGDLWEWTGTVMDRKEEDGYRKSEVYPGYSSDFFDGKHNVVLGASWATVPRIAERESFVNWYQRGYPYAMIGFRLATSI